MSKSSFILVGKRYINVANIGFFDDTCLVLNIRDEDGGSIVIDNPWNGEDIMSMIEDVEDANQEEGETSAEVAALQSIIAGQNALLKQAKAFVKIIAESEDSDRLTRALHIEVGIDRFPSLVPDAKQWLKDYTPDSEE